MATSYPIILIYYGILYAGSIFDHSITWINISAIIIIICINMFLHLYIIRNENHGSLYNLKILSFNSQTGHQTLE